MIKQLFKKNWLIGHRMSLSLRIKLLFKEWKVFQKKNGTFVLYKIYNNKSYFIKEYK
jgi:hypothetical protein